MNAQGKVGGKEAVLEPRALGCCMLRWHPTRECWTACWFLIQLPDTAQGKAAEVSPIAWVATTQDQTQQESAKASVFSLTSTGHEDQLESKPVDEDHPPLSLCLSS